MTKELRILMLEDQPADAELVMHELRRAGIQFAGKRVASEAEFLAQLRDAPPDLILADYSLPAYDGPSALTAAQRQCPEIPFIFVSGTMGEETAIEALHHGATDYVLKQRLTRLGPAMQRALDEVEERTRRRQVEAALLASERNYREIFNAANDAIFLHDAETGAILDVNQTALDMLGYSRGELQELPGDQFCVGPAFSHQEAVRRLRQASAEGPQVFEWRSKRKNGELFWTEVALRAANIGGQGRVLAVVRDITQRKSVERALAESRGLQKAILDNIPDPAWLKDIQGRFLACNEPMARIYDLNVKEILGKTVFDIIPAEAERLTREDQQVIATEKPIRVEHPFPDARGQHHWFETIKSPIFNELGEVTGTVGIARETTERRQTDEALQVSEDRFRSVWEHSIDGMRLIDREGRILAVNEAFCRLVKLPREKLIGEVFSVAYDGQGPDEDIEAYRRRFDTGTIPLRLTARKRLWNSEEVDVEVSSSFVESGRQNKTLLSIFRDIAERKRAEERVAAFSELGQQLSAAKAVWEAGDIIVQVADQLLGWDACTLDLYSPELDRVYHVLTRDTINGQRVECAPVGHDAPPSPRARRTIESGGQLVLKDGVGRASPDRVCSDDTARPSASAMFAPVRDGSKVIGILSIHSYTPRAYDEHSLATLQSLANHCGGALNRIRTQEALLREQEFTRALLDNIADGVVACDAKGTVVLFNRTAREWHCLDAVALPPDGWATQYCLGGPDGLTPLPTEAVPLARACHGEAIRDVSLTLVANGLPPRYILASGGPFFDASKNKLGAVLVLRDLTKHKQLEQALLDSSQFSQQIVASAQEGIIVFAPDLKYQVWNPFMEQLTGFPASQVLGKHPAEVFPFLEEAGMLASLKQALAGEPTPRTDFPFNIPQTGKMGWTAQTNAPLRNLGGEIIGVIATVRDITERKRAELRLETFSNLGQQLSAAKSAREAAEIIVEVADQLLGWDACTLDLYAREHDRLVNVLNRDTINDRRVDFPSAYQDEPPSPLARRTFERGGQLILKEDPEAMQPDGVSFGNTARPSACIMLVPVRQGSRVIGLFSIHSYTPRAYDPSSLETLQALADHCAGALDRISAQEALSSSEANYRSLVERSPDAIFLHREGTFVYANPAGLKLLGTEKPEQVLALSVFDIVPPENRDTIRQRIKQAGEGGMTPLLEQKIVRLDGTSLDAEAISIPFTYEGRPAVQTIMRDISGRKQLEQQLRQSQKMEAIGQLAGGVAHDFNNMLAVIRGNADLLLMGAQQHTPETKACLKQVTAASDRAANLTRQLLAFSRKQVMQSRPLVLNDVIADLSKMLKRIIGEHIDLQCRYAAQLPFVQADAGMIEQVLLNLAVNARDAMPRGGHLLITTDTASFDAAYARTHPEGAAGEFVCLTVSDTGTGIAPEHLPRIFEPFFSTKEIGKGTGLGLATVYGIVTQHRGWIEVASQPGAGATFKIFLPVIPTPVSVAATPQAAAELPGGTETILLVEDDYAVRMITRRVLESRGYKIYEATTASEALDVWNSRGEAIAMLLTDIVMPQGVTGRDLAEQLRAQRPALKVVFMSGYSADVIGKDTAFFRRTQSSFLQKPCSARALLEAVRRCLDGK